MKKFMKVLVISFICFAFVMGTGAYIFFNSVQEDPITGEVDIDKVNSPEGKEPVNVLILGVDTRDGEKGKGSRTDTMMVANFNPQTKKATVISIPRDTRVAIRGRKGMDKINHAHAYGGTDLSIKAVKDLLGIPIHYYVKIDYEGLWKIVDEIGGVEVDVPMDMKYSDPYADPPLKIDLKKGKQVLDGNKAMQFVRFRKGYADQDLGRINAQHTFLMALADELLGPKAIVKLPILAKTFSTYVKTDMPISKITAYALKAAGVGKEDIHMVTIPGEPKQMRGVWYFVPDTEKIESAMEAILSEQQDTENVSSKQSFLSHAEEDIKIEVLNGSGIGGLAKSVAEKLEDQGYDVVNIGNVQGIKYSETHIYDRKEKDSEARKIAKLLNVKEVEKDLNEQSEVDITIIVGSDQQE